MTEDDDRVTVRLAPVLGRAALTMLIISSVSLLGPIIYAYDRSLFDLYEMAGVIFIPIAYILTALSIHSRRSKRLPDGLRPAYGRLLSAICLGACVMSIIATLGTSPGGPAGLRDGLWFWLGLSALFSALWSYRLQLLLAQAP